MPQLGRVQCRHAAANSTPAAARSQWHRQTLPCSSVHPGCPVPPLKEGGKEGPLTAAILLHHMERSRGRKLLKNRCQQNSFPLVWVLGSPKRLLTSLATPTTKQRDGLGEGGRRGERTLPPPLLSPSLGIPQQEGGSRPALKASPLPEGVPALSRDGASRTAEPEAQPQAELPQWWQCPTVTRTCHPRSLSRATTRGQCCLRRRE